jgi:type VI secretion system protein ImpG
MIEHYFEDEMRYLQEAGKAFAEVHPDRARYLNVDSLTDRDPHVERLFEGVAFLTARVREQLDDELPQYTEGLLRLMHPHLVRPVPSFSVLEFTPRPGMLQETTVFEPGVEVQSRPVSSGEDVPTPCRFTTTAPVTLQPIELTGVRLEWPDAESSTAVLTFSVDRNADLRALDLARLRLYFYADPTDASRMHLYFTRHVAGLTVSAGGQEVHRHGQRWVTPVGLDADERLLPSSPYSLSGYQLLQEYFCFRPKFWFVDLGGLDALREMPEADTFTVRVHFNRAYPEKWAFGEQNLRLHCTPVANLFQTDATPVRVTHRASEYRVYGDVRRPRTMPVYDVRRVVGTESATGRRHEYEPFLSFSRDRSGTRVFSETSRIGPSGSYETYVSVGGWGASVERLTEETLTMEVRCTNGNLPREELREGDVTQPGPGYVNVASFRNLTQPSRELLPPLDRHPDLFWMLVSHLALNRTSVLSVEALTNTLRLYDWANTAGTRRRIDGIRSVDWVPSEMLDRGSIRRGAEVRLEVEDGHFADEGDLCLFGNVLHRFLSTYATINTFVRLTVTTHPSARTVSWNPLDGSLPLL